MTVSAGRCWSTASAYSDRPRVPAMRGVAGHLGSQPGGVKRNGKGLGMIAAMVKIQVVEELRPGQSTGMMQGMAINRITRELRSRLVRAAMIDGVPLPDGVACYYVEMTRGGHVCKSVWADFGDHVTCLAADVGDGWTQTESGGADVGDLGDLTPLQECFGNA